MSLPDPNPSQPATATESGAAYRPGSTTPELSGPVGSIFDAVEREAEQLRAEAREEGLRYLQACRERGDELVRERRRQIAELSDELIARTEVVISGLESAAPVRAGFESLVRALGDAAERMSEGISDPEGEVPQPQPQAESPPQAAAPPSFAAPASAGWRDLDLARAAAIRGAAAGASRRQLAPDLETQIGPSQAKELLDQLFGPDSSPAARVPWTSFPG